VKAGLPSDIFNDVSKALISSQNFKVSSSDFGKLIFAGTIFIQIILIYIILILYF